MVRELRSTQTSMFTIMESNLTNNTVDGLTLSPMSNASGPLMMTEKGTFDLVIESMNRFVMPVIILVGLVGNTTSFVVFVCTHLKYQSSSIYLAFLNVVDNLFLVSLGIGVWFGWIRVHLVHTQVICQLIVYLTYVSSFLSVWTIVAFTIERYIVVFHPFKRQQYCTRGRARIVVVSLCVGASVGYSFALWTTGIHVIYGRNACVTHPKYINLMQTLTTVDTIMTLAIPSIAIVAFNCAIAVKIVQFFVQRRDNFSGEYALERVAQTDDIRRKTSKTDSSHPNGRNTGGESGNIHGSQATSSGSSERGVHAQQEVSTYKHVRINTVFHWDRNSVQMRATRSLLIVSTVFVLLNLPSHVVRVYVSVANSRPPLKLLLWQQIFQILSYCNFSINFFLYCACSRHFRKAFARMVRTSCVELHFRIRCYCVFNRDDPPQMPAIPDKIDLAQDKMMKPRIKPVDA